MSTDSSKVESTPKLPWNTGLGIVYLITLFFASQLLAGILLSIYPTLRGWSSSQATDWLNGSIPAQFFFILLAEALSIYGVYWFLRRYKTPLATIGLRKPRLRDFGYTLLAAPAYYFVYAIIVGVLSSLVKSFNVNQEQQIGFNGAHGVLPLLLTFISLVILPPIAEEIMMRGFLYTTLRKNLKIIPAAIITSLIFATAHLQLGQGAAPLYIAAVDTFILSLVLVALREKTGSLWAGIGLHATKNFIAFLALFVLHVR